MKPGKFILDWDFKVVDLYDLQTNKCLIELDKRFIDKEELKEKLLNIIHYFLFSEYDYDISKYVYDEKKADICVRLLDLIGVDEETEQLFWYVTTGKPKC